MALFFYNAAIKRPGMNHQNCINLKQYKKIYICGATGSGKTTLAHKLSEFLGYPHFETDIIKWNDKNRTKRTHAERAEILNHILSENDAWIIEGAQHNDWTNPIWENCDIAIMPSPPTAKRIFYILKRYIMREEIKKKHVSLGDVLNNIKYTLLFRKYYLPEFVKHAREYNKQIICADQIIGLAKMRNCQK
jgi:adenylate kinase family enzyme